MRGNLVELGGKSSNGNNIEPRSLRNDVSEITWYGTSINNEDRQEFRSNILVLRTSPLSTYARPMLNDLASRMQVAAADFEDDIFCLQFDALIFVKNH
ncbi:hypothetical protein BIW11_12129 [Tropilaelaps mercedesae]|uniref:Uncharacterized protein n=1 Tax=Tropilaelaps mercedesae TaxID=418985 RepID=A0A1V9X8D2_9ACAR|nr:hypothetical protein BIW11_12129 [Tropilaelaps mercedesae]